jgi:pimeloyl-ACP methyl ester carboxylesterase
MAARNANRHEPRADSPGTAVAVLGLFGVRDRFTGPAEVAEFGRVVPGSSVTTFDEAGHDYRIEQPTATFDWLRPFLASAHLIGEEEHA